MRAATYTRISRDYIGEARGVERQSGDTLALCHQLGHEVVARYEDNDVSAAGKARHRPQYEQMLADARAGNFDVIVAYSNSRLTRRPRELEDLLDLHREHGTQIQTCVSGSDDLSTADGRKGARQKVIDDAREAEVTGERVRRHKQQRVEEGKPLGQRFRTFGYERDWSVIESEKKIVQEIFSRAAKGESQNSITKDLVSRNIRTAAGGVWTALQTSRLLKTPKYAGFQTYKGNIVGKSSVVQSLVSEAEYQAVQNPRTGASFNFRKHLLSGILYCNECNAPMSGTRVVAKGKESARYRCDSRNGGCGSVSIKAEWVDDLINRYCAWWMIEAWLAAPEEDAEEEPQDNSVAIGAIDERIAKFQEAMGLGTIDIEDALNAIKAARGERNKLIKEDAARVKTVRFPQVEHFYPAWGYWDMSSDERRVIIKAAFPAIFVLPGKRSTRFNPDRLWALKEGEDRLLPGSALQRPDVREQAKEAFAAMTPDELGSYLAELRAAHAAIDAGTTA
jgi:site-specific DNA recombinase